MFWGRKLRSQNHRDGGWTGGTARSENEFDFFVNENELFFPTLFLRLPIGLINAFVQFIKLPPVARRFGLLRKIPGAAREAAQNRAEREEWHRKHDTIDNAEQSEPRQKAAGRSLHNARRLEGQN